MSLKSAANHLAAFYLQINKKRVDKFNV